ncbi:MAG TPA: Gfo/Idh/MocA family oxidoreductase [Candidatus Avipropionibacterium avicola]|uniref:Gfo/Idh/MocA family oxidoreductase n=1 Tax=Candidatus Avipropionibacterium avicola TaxID=2840701 RepID=A0A9D1GXU8_9ACTN|nr:Gfo/Idh/MocA family oxidoreductase [Candidatus Avipropionibacterium avicola]
MSNSDVTSIGVIGIENSHVNHFIRHLNNENRHPGFRVTTLVGGEPERRAELSELGAIDQQVDEPAELLGKVDAAIISTRDGGLHAEQALPLLKAGMPVLVDKPLAASVADAEAMIAAARENNALLLSSSALRAVPEMADLSQIDSAERGRTAAVNVIGPADPDSPYSGLTFYGIHEVEAALEICGNGPFGDVSVQRVDGCIVATTVINDINVTITFVTADDQGQIKFFASVAGRHGITQTPLTLSADYNAPMLDMFIEMISSGKAPVSDELLLRPIQLLEAIVTQL